MVYIAFTPRSHTYIYICIYIYNPLFNQYTGSLIALLLVGLIGGVLVFIYRGKVQDLVVKFIREEGIVRYRDDPDLQNIFDWMQQKVKLNDGLLVSLASASSL